MLKFYIILYQISINWDAIIHRNWYYKNKHNIRFVFISRTTVTVAVLRYAYKINMKHVN